MKPRVALTIGDPNGIGPEIAVKAARACLAHGGPDIVLVGDKHVLHHYAELIAPDLPVRDVDAAAEAGRGLYVASVAALPADAFRPGRIAPEAGRATVAYVRHAVELVHAGVATAIVAAPHSETAVNAAGISFSGYPGLIADLTGLEKDDVFLMLVGANLRIVHVTLHEALPAALARLSPALIERAIMAADRALRAMGIERPRIGVFGINPHAGEGGLFGSEDDRIVSPLVHRLRDAGFDLEGPQGADLMLTAPGFDAFVAMYHDQGHIPIKLLAGRNAAAISIGADVIFSSVGHGSAFDIAGQGIASAEPLLRAIHLVSGTSAPSEGLAQ